ncbi:MAG TPA: MarR family transcriptional regulator [Conexibacter sp.]|nr:MarR family transcriptional regulator [Conexibacter sp.]
MDEPGPGVPQRLRGLPSWQLNRAALRANRLTGERLAAAGLRKHHYAVLVSLDEQGAASQAALGERLSIDRSDIVGTLTELERTGLVSRAQDERDRRRNVVSLTSSGAASLARLSAEIDAAQDELLAPLTEKERRKLRKLLARVTEPSSGG